jgi:hypothetical protein
MVTWRIVYTRQARKDAKKLAASGLKMAAQSLLEILQEDPFDIIKQKDFEILGINPADIPPGAYAAHRHPTLLSSRFGGNAYGSGFFEIYSHLGKEDRPAIANRDNQVAKLVHGAELARHSHHRLVAALLQLPGGELHVLSLESASHVGVGEAEGFQLLAVHEHLNLPPR